MHPQEAYKTETPYFQVESTDKKGAAAYAAQLVMEAVECERQAAALHKEAAMKRRLAQDWQQVAKRTGWVDAAR